MTAPLCIDMESCPPALGRAQAWSVCCSTSESTEEDALVDEGAPHEVLIRHARSALAEGSASEETMVRMQFLG